MELSTSPLNLAQSGKNKEMNSNRDYRRFPICLMLLFILSSVFQVDQILILDSKVKAYLLHDTISGRRSNFVSVKNIDRTQNRKQSDAKVNTRNLSSFLLRSNSLVPLNLSLDSDKSNNKAQLDLQSRRQSYQQQFSRHQSQRKTVRRLHARSNESATKEVEKRDKTTRTKEREEIKNSNEIQFEKGRYQNDEKSDSPLRKSVGEGFGIKRAKTKTVNARLIKEINRELEAKEAEAEEYNTQNSVDFEATLTEEEKQRKAEKERIEKEDEEALADLNGINPRFALFGSGFTLFLSFVFWRITQGMAVTFNNLHIETDLYPVQRVANTASTALIGLAALGTGIFGGIGLGLTALTTRIIYGVATGELDPNKPRKATSKELEEEMERRNPSMVDKEGKVKFTKPWWEETFDDTDGREDKDNNNG